MLQESVGGGGLDGRVRAESVGTRGLGDRRRRRQRRRHRPGSDSATALANSASSRSSRQAALHTLCAPLSMNNELSTFALMTIRFFFYHVYLSAIKFCFVSLIMCRTFNFCFNANSLFNHVYLSAIKFCFVSLIMCIFILLNFALCH